MSEYQYYEWQTLDRPLTAEEQSAVDALSSHIEVTATSAWVEYNWGDFKHDPRQVLVRYFDAFLYYANWGDQQLSFRFPKSLLDEDQVLLYVWEECVDLQRHGEYLVLDIAYPEGDSDWLDKPPSLSSLAGLRDDILRGDYRTLYLAWLRAAEMYGEDDDFEPPVPPGLKELTTPLIEFIRFFQIDPFLVTAAAERSESRRITPAPVLDAAIERLSREECNAFLLRLAHGEPLLTRALTRRLQEVAGLPTIRAASTGRTWDDLQARAQELEGQETKRNQAEAEAKRLAELQSLALTVDQTWREVHNLIEQKAARSYDQAVALLVKLRELAAYQNDLPAFQAKMRALQAKYSSRPALQQRFRDQKLT